MVTAVVCHPLATSVLKNVRARLQWKSSPFYEENCAPIGSALLDSLRPTVRLWIRESVLGAEIREDFSIGCRILTQPFFFHEHDWIPVPASWSPNIVTFKTYDASEGMARNYGTRFKIVWPSLKSR